MNPVTLFSTLVIVLSLLNVVSAWAFTEINFDTLEKSFAENFEEFENVITDNDLKQLKFNLIYPGTKWCGPGNVASDYDDLGPERETDMCCRDHDHCPDLIEAGETKHNLTNTAFYTRLNCKCDETFRKCLRNVTSSVSTQVGTFYFDVLDTKCYRRYYPVTGCKRYGGWFNNKCLEYSFNWQGEQVYQWFDVPYY